MLARRLLPLLFAAFLGTAACAAPTTDSGEETESAESNLEGEGKFKDTKGKMEEIRGDLASNQSHLRGVLDSKQQTAYAAAFWKLKRVTDARSAYIKAATDLGVSLSKKTADLKKTKRFSTSDPRLIGDMMDAYENAKALAASGVIAKGSQSPAMAVRDFYVFLASNEDARKVIGKSDKDLAKDLGANHALVMAELAATNPSSDGVGLIRDSIGVVGSVSTVAKDLQTRLERFAGGDISAIEGGDGVGKTTGAVVAMFHLGTLANDVLSGKYKKFLEDTLKGGAGDVASIANAVTLFEGAFESGQAASIISKASNVSKVAGRFAAGIGVVTSTMSLISDIERYDGDRLLHIARIASDASALSASMVALLGLEVAAPYVGAIVLLTQGILAIANYWHKHEASKRRNADTKEVLKAIGFSKDVADCFADGNRDVLSWLTGKGEGELGLAPADMQSLAKNVVKLPNGPFAFFQAPDSSWVGDAAEVRRILVLTGPETVEMLTKTTGDDGVMVRVAFGFCLSMTGGVYTDRAHLKSAIDACAKEGEDEDRAAFSRLASFVATH